MKIFALNVINPSHVFRLKLKHMPAASAGDLPGDEVL